VHKNKSVKGFGSYGDLMIRDRKMYVVPTPFRLLDGVAHQQTMILPADVGLGDAFIEVGRLGRREADELIIGYAFDLRANEIQQEKVPNPGAGREHRFRTWRVTGSPATPVTIRSLPAELVVPEADHDSTED
jgi:hypothetical protein